MKVKLRHIAIIFGIVIVFYAGYRLFAGLAFSGAAEKKYSRKDAIANYNKREKQITDLVNYFKSKIPDNKTIAFGLGESDNSFNIGIALPGGAVDKNYPNIGGSNLKLNSDKMDSLLVILNWTNETIDTLKAKLKKSDCINIMSGDPIRIQYRYSGLGLHSYLIFNKALADSTIKIYNKELGDTVIGKNVVVIYTSSL